MKPYRILSVPQGLALIFAALALGIFLILISSRAPALFPLAILPSGGSLLQALTYLIGSLVVWYASHPLSHYLSAKISGIKTSRFYIGRSELRKIDVGTVRKFAGALITVGTKLEPASLYKASKGRKALVLGAGAIVSACVAAVLFFVSLVLPQLGILTKIVAFLFLIFTLGNELLLSPKAGDIAKMKRALGSGKSLDRSVKQ